MDKQRHFYFERSDDLDLDLDPTHRQRALARMEDTGELIACKVEGKPSLRRADFPAH